MLSSMPSTTSPIPDFYAVIPAGGAGTRLWPLSRSGSPKFLHDLTGSGRTLIQATVDRIAGLTGPAGVVVVTGVAHAAAVGAQLPEVAAADILAEPSPRDSMAAIGLAAAVVAERHGDVVIGSFAADQVITGAAAFEQAVREGVRAAQEGYVATIGIAASRPSTAFGYIHSGAPLGLDGAPSALRVEGFTEKPDAITAQRYLATGEYRWNASIFITKTSVLLGHLAAQRPALHAGLIAIAKAWDTAERDEVLARVWPGLEKIAIDHAVAEPVADAGGVVVVPGNFGWDDVGDFNSLAALLPADDEAGSKVLGDAGQVIRVQSAGSVVVPSGKRVITILGLDDVVVVDTPDALLVTTRARAQQVKDMVAELRERGLEELL
ncbi:mannose-1-phosphate guanylyltransferase [Sanguibacter gelidistatuariae]|uniref:Mannose-1-phosphate guanylyltransferase n=2 Tax=Sanguibacter gelidistatuariae TaxID=1814289 RepID=A0A1G6MI40_9MICO|nr:mannose-1-phosphate guanylyltransferase [Sanguibacter gelidistatuariae]